LPQEKYQENSCGRGEDAGGGDAADDENVKNGCESSGEIQELPI
jgi:hypothetical protein